MSSLKNDKVFIKELIRKFPKIKEDILDEDYLGITSLQIGVFRRFTQSAINNNDLVLVKKCFDFVLANIDLVMPEIENSLVVSYLGKLSIPLNSSVEKLLPPKLKDIIDKLNSYYLLLSKDEKLNKFMEGLKDKKI
jgi:hypothetical protein